MASSKTLALALVGAATFTCAAAAYTSSIYNGTTCSGPALDTSSGPSGSCESQSSGGNEFSVAFTCNTANTGGYLSLYSNGNCADAPAFNVTFENGECVAPGGALLNISFRSTCSSGNSAAGSGLGYASAVAAGVGAALLTWM